MVRAAIHLLLMAAGAALILYVEWHTDEVTVVLALLLLVAAGLGAARPRGAIVSGIVIGLVIPVAYLVVTLSGRFQPLYQVAPPSLVDAAVMCALVFPATAAALAGAWARRRLRK
jgi:lipopolysaccharide export LptBFGC system permease protein LptF